MEEDPADKPTPHPPKCPPPAHLLAAHGKAPLVDPKTICTVNCRFIGKLDVSVDLNTGELMEIGATKAVSFRELGIEVGWFMSKLDGMPFSLERLGACYNSKKHYLVTFSKMDQQPLLKAKPKSSPAAPVTADEPSSSGSPQAKAKVVPPPPGPQGVPPPPPPNAVPHGLPAVPAVNPQLVQAYAQAHAQAQLQAVQILTASLQINLAAQAAIGTSPPGPPTNSSAPAFRIAADNSDLIGQIIIQRPSVKPLQLQAALLYGARASLRRRLQQEATRMNGFMTISHRVPFKDMVCRTPIAILVFGPEAASDEAVYAEYMKYFESKKRAGVINLPADAADTSPIGGELSLYIAPKAVLETGDDFCSYVEAGVNSLDEVAHAALTLLQERSTCLIGIIAPPPFASAGGNEGIAAQPIVGLGLDRSLEHDKLDNREIDNVQGVDHMLDEVEGLAATDDQVQNTEGDDTEDSADEIVIPGAACKTNGAPQDKTSDTGTKKSIALSSFLGDWQDSFGGDVHVHRRLGIQELHVRFVCSSREDLLFMLTQHGDGSFQCGQYILDTAASDESLMVWAQASGPKRRTWKRVDAPRKRKASRSRSLTKDILRKHRRSASPPGVAANLSGSGEACDGKSSLPADLQNRLDSLLSKLT